MEKQEIFEKVAKHLLTQGKKSVYAHGDGDTLCSYKSPDGLQCAIGILIKDEFYFPGMEGQRATGKDVFRALERSLPNFPVWDNREFLQGLQHIHDDHDPPEMAWYPETHG